MSMTSHISRVIFQKQGSLQMSLTCNSATKCCGGLRMRLCSFHCRAVLKRRSLWRSVREQISAGLLQLTFPVSDWCSRAPALSSLYFKPLLALRIILALVNLLGWNQFLLQEPFLLLLLSFPHSCQVSSLHHASLWVWSGCTEVLPSSEDLIAWIK